MGTPQKNIEESYATDTPPQLFWVERFNQQWREKTLRPTYVQWISTYRCNFRCPHCGTAAGDARPDELTTKEILGVLDTLAELGCQIFSVTGGEPLLREDIFDILKYAKAKGMKVGFVTNGYIAENYVDKLRDVKLDSVLISIDGYKENHEAIRGVKGSYDKCIGSVKLFREIGVPMVAVSSVMLDKNVDDLPKIFKDVFKNGCVKARVQPLVPEGRAKGTKNNPESVKKTFKIVYDLRETGLNVDMSEGFGYVGPIEDRLRSFNFFCGCGWNTFTIMHNGSVMGCPALDFPELGEGNLREKDLKRIWWNGFDRFRRTIIKDLPPKCKECEYKQVCRGGCWLFRANNADPCFLDEARQVSKELGVS